MTLTYLHTCLKDDATCRWPDSAMPIKVYIAPFIWYQKKKQQESLMYRQLVLDSLDAWRKASNGLVRFLIVDKLNQSQLDFKWRRVDRRTLGHCTYEIDAHNRLFSAEIQIGISDGLVHAAYQDANEVQHTILHEIGHALGLIDHSDGPDDIMYVPHQYGVHVLSARDAATLRWLYQLPVGFQYRAVGAKYNLKPGFGINDVIRGIEQRIQGETETLPPSTEAPAPSPPPMPSSLHPAVRNTASLDEQHAILSEMGRFYLQTQNIQISRHHQEALRKALLQRQRDNTLPPPPAP